MNPFFFPVTVQVLSPLSFNSQISESVGSPSGVTKLQTTFLFVAFSGVTVAVNVLDSPILSGSAVNTFGCRCFRCFRCFRLCLRIAGKQHRCYQHNENSLNENHFLQIHFLPLAAMPLSFIPLRILSCLYGRFTRKHPGRPSVQTDCRGVLFIISVKFTVIKV